MRLTEDRKTSLMAEIKFRLICFLVPSHYEDWG